jgi:hypothetical protein
VSGKLKTKSSKPLRPRLKKKQKKKKQKQQQTTSTSAAEAQGSNNCGLLTTTLQKTHQSKKLEKKQKF